MDDTSNFLIGTDWGIKKYFSSPNKRTKFSCEARAPGLRTPKNEFTYETRERPWFTPLIRLFLLVTVSPKAFTGIPISIDLLAGELFRQWWLSYARCQKCWGCEGCWVDVHFSWHIEWTAISPIIQKTGQLNFKKKCLMGLMTVWFRIGIRIIFLCYKKSLMIVSRQLLREIPKSNAFLLVSKFNTAIYVACCFKNFIWLFLDQSNNRKR